jgi:hypothetical protein
MHPQADRGAVDDLDSGTSPSPKPGVDSTEDR